MRKRVPMSIAPVVLLLWAALAPSAVAAEEAAGLLVADTFSRADSWSLGSAETGQAWQVWHGTVTVQGGQARPTQAGYDLAVVDAGAAVGRVGVTVPEVGPELWLILRASNSGNYWRFGRWQGGPYQLQQVQGWALGSPTVTTAATVQPVAGDRIECASGASISCSVNGTLVATSEDTFNASAQHVGFASASGGAAEPHTVFDDVLATGLEPSATLSVAAQGPQTAEAGTRATWSVVVANDGDAPASAAVLQVSSSPVLGDVQLSSAGGCGTSAADSCALGDLAPGAQASVSVTGTVPDSTSQVEVSFDAVATSGAGTVRAAATSSVSVTTPIPDDAVVVDDFDRPDAWSMGAAVTGQSWQVWSGTARTSGGTAIASVPGYTLAVVDAGTAQGVTSAAVPQVSTDFWLILRASNNGNYWRFGRSAGADTYQLEQVQGWAMGSPMVRSLASARPAAGDQLSCRYRRGITCSVNGTDVASTADPFNAAATYSGIAAAGSDAPPAARFDRFRVLQLPAGPDLLTEVTVDRASVLAGEPLTWTARVRNDGPGPAQGVALTSTVRGDVADLAGAAGSTCTSVGSALTCAVGDLAPGATAQVAFSARALDVPATYEIVVEAAGAPADIDPATDVASSRIDVRSLAAPGEVFLDDFGRPDSPTLGNAPGGRPWRMVNGSVGIVGGRAAKTGGVGYATALIDPGFTFGSLEVTVASGAADGFHVLFHARDAANHFRVGPDWTGNYRVDKIVNGQWRNLQFGQLRANVAARDGDVIRVVVRPDDGWFLSVNGVHVADGGDLDLYEEFHYGLAAASGSVRFDDLSIRQTLSTGIVTIDTFSRADGTVLEGQAPSSGTQFDWRAPYGYWVHRSGGVVLESPGGGTAVLEVGSELADVSVTVRGAHEEAWLVFRGEEAGSAYRFGRRAGGRYEVQLVDTSGEQAPLPVEVSVVDWLTAGDGDRLTVEQSSDGRVRGYVNGTLVLSFVDPLTNAHASRYGVAGSMGVAFDDLVVTP